MTDLRGDGAATLAAMDRALAARPAKDGTAFSEATGHLCALRTSLIAEGRQDALPRLNGIISCALAGHFPLGPVPWPLIECAREALEGLLNEAAG